MNVDVQKNARVMGAAWEEEDLGGYTHAMALLQFAAIALGYMVVMTLDKVEGGGEGLSRIARGLADAGFWVLLLPLAWYIAAVTIMRMAPLKTAQRIIGWSGTLLTLGIVVLLILSVFL